MSQQYELLWDHHRQLDMTTLLDLWKFNFAFNYSYFHHRWCILYMSEYDNCT